MTAYWGRLQKQALGALALALLSSGCASMYNEQIADIDSSHGTLKPFEIQANATGLNVHDGAAVTKALATDEATRERAGWLETIVALTQMGPQTGNPTFGDTWADGMVNELLQRCPSGQITGLSARRETMKYPVISGEIVTIKGYCVL